MFLQTVENPDETALNEDFHVCLISLLLIQIIKIFNKKGCCPNLPDRPNLPDFFHIS